MMTQISFTADEELKDKALMRAKKEGITLKALLTFSMRSFVEGKMKLDIVPTHTTDEQEVEEIFFSDQKIQEKAEKLAKLLS